MSRVHVIGAGVAGLAAALACTTKGYAVTLYDGATRAGGRCRSFNDTKLNALIDNGNHLMLSANWAVKRFLAITGSEDRLYQAPNARFPFLDLKTGARWCVEPNRGRVPWWILSPRRRVPDTGLGDYLAAGRILFARPEDTMATTGPTHGPLYDRFLLPLCEAVMNCSPDQASAQLMRAVLMESFAQGADACRPMIALDGLSDALVDPALDYLRAKGAQVRLSSRLNSLEIDRKRVAELIFAKDRIELGVNDQVVLALPPEKAGPLLQMTVPVDAVPIVNVHFRLPNDVTPDGNPSLLGLVGGTAHWLFCRGRIASVTVSNAAQLAQEDADTILSRCWADVAKALDLDPDDQPPGRVIKEKRATFLQTPEAVARRPNTRTDVANLVLAGDWTDTGLPATIEGAIRSGFAAADALAAPDRAQAA